MQGNHTKYLMEELLKNAAVMTSSPIVFDRERGELMSKAAACIEALLATAMEVQDEKKGTAEAIIDDIFAEIEARKYHLVYNPGGKPPTYAVTDVRIDEFKKYLRDHVADHLPSPLAPKPPVEELYMDHDSISLRIVEDIFKRYEKNGMELKIPVAGSCVTPNSQQMTQMKARMQLTINEHLNVYEKALVDAARAEWNKKTLNSTATASRLHAAIMKKFEEMGHDFHATSDEIGAVIDKVLTTPSTDDQHHTSKAESGWDKPVPATSATSRLYDAVIEASVHQGYSLGDLTKNKINEAIYNVVRDLNADATRNDKPAADPVHVVVTTDALRDKIVAVFSGYLSSNDLQLSKYAGTFLHSISPADFWKMLGDLKQQVGELLHSSPVALHSTATTEKVTTTHINAALQRIADAYLKGHNTNLDNGTARAIESELVWMASKMNALHSAPTVQATQTAATETVKATDTPLHDQLMAQKRERANYFHAMRKCIDAYHLYHAVNIDAYNVSADRLAGELADMMFDLNSAVKDGVGPRERYLREAAYVLTRAVRDVELGVSIHNERVKSQPRIEGPVWVALSKKRAAVEELLENPGLAAEPQQVSVPKEESRSATSEDVELAVESYHHATRFYTDSFSIHEWERQSRKLGLTNEQFVTGLRKILVE